MTQIKHAINEEYKSEVFLMDCMEGMKQFEDNHFDLACVDVPYGININESIGRRKGDLHSGHKKAYWDNVSPSAEYFTELFRVSKNQIVWGANHFISKMPFDSSCWLLWDKKFSDEVSFSQFEMAWTSFKGTTKKYDRSPLQGKKYHPTQKPIELYDWIFSKYAEQGHSILDSHLGSQSSRISANKNKLHFTGFELDPDYFRDGNKRYEDFVSQLTLF